MTDKRLGQTSSNIALKSRSSIRRNTVRHHLLVFLSISLVVANTTSYAYPNKSWTALKSCPSLEAAERCIACKDTGTEVQFIVNVKDQIVERQSRTRGKGDSIARTESCVVLDPATWSCESQTSNGLISHSHMMIGVYTEVVSDSITRYFCAEGSKLVF